jgi:hypothetical protein
MSGQGLELFHAVARGQVVDRDVAQATAPVHLDEALAARQQLQLEQVAPGARQHRDGLTRVELVGVRVHHANLAGHDVAHLDLTRM